MEHNQFTSLTEKQKLQALATKYYQYQTWIPKAGDYYTSARADLELYQVVKIEEGFIYTRYCSGSESLSKWEESKFTTEGFGLVRVHVPEWILNQSS